MGVGAFVAAADGAAVGRMSAAMEKRLDPSGVGRLRSRAVESPPSATPNGGGGGSDGDCVGLLLPGFNL